MNRDRRSNLPEPSHPNEMDNQQYPACGALVSSALTSNVIDGLGRQVLNHTLPPAIIGKRMRWNKDHNENVMKAYFRATRCDTQTTGYRATFLKEWNRIYPTSALTVQRLCDQCRVIKSGKLLSDSELQLVKSNVNKEISNSFNAISNNSIHSEDTRQTSENLETSDDHHETFNAIRSRSNSQNTFEIEDPALEIENQISEKSIVSNQMIDEFLSIREEFEIIPALSRPRLPKLNYNKATKIKVQQVNAIVEDKCKIISTIFELHLIAYCAAVYVARSLKLRFPKDTTNEETKAKRTNVPPWKHRLEKKISELRSDLSRILNWQRDGEIRPHPKSKLGLLLRKYKIRVDTKEFTSVLNCTVDTLKQKIAASGKRLARYNKCLKRQEANNRFNNNQKSFYQSLDESKDSVKQGRHPDKTEIISYWENIWAVPINHNEDSDWIQKEEIRMTEVQEMETPTITVNDIQQTVRNLHNWKAPGMDNIHNYWWKNLTALHPFMATLINDAIAKPDSIPEFLFNGITFLKAKSNQTEDPKNFRPITCLCTLYKIITSLISSKMNSHLLNNRVWAEEQKGCRKNSQGCKEQLIIDSVITKQAYKKSRNISIAWIDYQKAYDSVPHSWLLEILKIYKINSKIVTCLEYCMSKWSTQLAISLPGMKFTSEVINIRRGIFQGDTLSPIWFCLAMNPLSSLLNQNGFGYKVDRETSISHLLYMDDLKLYAKNEKQLTEMLETTAMFSNDICMTFGLSKCAQLHVKRGKVQRSENMNAINNVDNIGLPVLGEDDSYKYLGIKQSFLQDKAQMKKEVTSKFTKRTKQVLKSGLNGKNLIRAINGFCIPVLLYTFGVLPWSETEVEGLDRTIRVLLTTYRCHHPKAAKERLYLPRQKGGRGLINCQQMKGIQILKLKKYFLEKSKESIIHKAIEKADIHYSPLNLSEPTMIQPITETSMISRWNEKVMHGRFPKALEASDKKASVKWLCEGTLYGETEGFIIAIQDEMIATKNHQKFVQKLNIPNDLCRLCNSKSETIQHLTSGCSSIANTEYLHRHNLSCKIVHLYLATKFKFIKNEIKYYKYDPEPVLENYETKIYYDRQVITDITVKHNRPDIIFIDKINKVGTIIDLAHPNDHNLASTFATKILKYTELSKEIKTMWKLEKINIIPIVVSVNGLIHVEQARYLKLLDIPFSITFQIQRSVILETCRIVRKIMS